MGKLRLGESSGWPWVTWLMSVSGFKCTVFGSEPYTSLLTSFLVPECGLRGSRVSYIVFSTFIIYTQKRYQRLSHPISGSKLRVWSTGPFWGLWRRIYPAPWVVAGNRPLPDLQSPPSDLSLMLMCPEHTWVRAQISPFHKVTQDIDLHPILKTSF
jgi:hypothetical protein